MGLGKKDKSYCQTSCLGPTGCPTAPSTARGRSCCRVPAGDHNVVLFPGAQSRGSHTGRDTQDPLPCTADPATTGPVWGQTCGIHTRRLPPRWKLEAGTGTAGSLVPLEGSGLHCRARTSVCLCVCVCVCVCGGGGGEQGIRRSDSGFPLLKYRQSLNELVGLEGSKNPREAVLAVWGQKRCWEPSSHQWSPRTAHGGRPWPDFQRLPHLPSHPTSSFSWNHSLLPSSSAPAGPANHMPHLDHSALAWTTVPSPGARRLPTDPFPGRSAWQPLQQHPQDSSATLAPTSQGLLIGAQLWPQPLSRLQTKDLLSVPRSGRGISVGSSGFSLALHQSNSSLATSYQLNHYLLQ